MVARTHLAKASAFREMVYQWGQQKAGSVAYFCMEYGIHSKLPIYSGGLGILAGDTVKSAADLGKPLVGIGLLYRDGYFTQKIAGGRQKHEAQHWNPNKYPDLVDLKDMVTIPIAGEKVNFRLWGYPLRGINGDLVPLILLDSIGAPNSHYAETTSQLYKAGTWERLMQEMALGIGGVHALSWCGIPIAYYHLNEGHAAFATVEVLRRLGKSFEHLGMEDVNKVRELFSFTTHTPVPAGFDKFEIERINYAFSDAFLRSAAVAFGRDPNNPSFLNMATLAMRFSGVKNGVSILHAQVSEELFPDFKPIIAITNGVHHRTWISKPIARLLDEFCPGWKNDPAKMSALAEKKGDQSFGKKLWQAHLENKRELLQLVKRTSGIEMDEETLTIGFARRFATYKRGNLIFTNESELLRIANEIGGLQLIFSGKAHPADGPGKDVLAHVIETGKRIMERSKGRIKFLFLPNYDMNLGAALTAGVDIWLNNPLRPHEASGTSGMKAAHNGVPNLSVPDGWWMENRGGGWTIGDKNRSPVDSDPQLYLADSSDLYRSLREIGQAYHRPAFLDKMIEELAGNASYFNTHRMVEDYFRWVWRSRIIAPAPLAAEKAEADISVPDLMLGLGRTIFAISEAVDDSQIESIAAESILKHLSGSRRITRYDAHNESVRIGRRWISMHFGEVIDEEFRSQMGESGFDHWKMLEQFSGEVMADLVRERKIQVVVDPKQDPRCYRDQILVSQEPFMLIPEIVNGEMRGAYKIDFYTGKLKGAEKENAYLNVLMEVIGKAKAKNLALALKEDLDNLETEDEVINWALVLMTAGGFVDMPRYAAETNRAAIFLSNNSSGGLAAKQAIGSVSESEHWNKLIETKPNLFREGAQKFLRGLDQSKSRLNLLIQGKSIGHYGIYSPLKVQDGIDIFDFKEFNGAFDSRKLKQLKDSIEELFSVNGRKIDNYLLLPIKGKDGKLYGLVYIDNTFSGNPLSPEKYLAIIDAAISRIISIRSASALK